jgi:hypothetical protein
MQGHAQLEKAKKEKNKTREKKAKIKRQTQKGIQSMTGNLPLPPTYPYHGWIHGRLHWRLIPPIRAPIPIPNHNSEQ